MVKEFLRHWSIASPVAHGERQVGAMPYALVDGRVVFLLITSRHSGRWIFPKGRRISSLSLWDSAAREAFEEAGVEGEVAHKPIGAYTATLSDTEHSLVEVDLYPLHVTKQLESWPEMADRHRHWALLADTRRLLAQRRLAALADALSRQLVQAPQPVSSRKTQ